MVSHESGRSRTCLLTQAEAETALLRVKPLPLGPLPHLSVCGMEQSSRLALLVLETVV